MARWMHGPDRVWVLMARALAWFVDQFPWKCACDLHKWRPFVAGSVDTPQRPEPPDGGDGDVHVGRSFLGRIDVTDAGSGRRWAAYGLVTADPERQSQRRGRLRVSGRHHAAYQSIHPPHRRRWIIHSNSIHLSCNSIAAYELWLFSSWLGVWEADPFGTNIDFIGIERVALGGCIVGGKGWRIGPEVSMTLPYNSIQDADSKLKQKRDPMS